MQPDVDLNLIAIRCRFEVRSYRRLTTELKVLQAASLKSLYAYVNHTLSPKPNLVPLYGHTDPNTLLYLFMIHKAFNNYFPSVFTLDDGTLPNFPLRTDNNMAPFTFSLEVRNVLLSSRSSYTISPYGFPAYLLSKFAGELAEPINTLFNMFLTQSAIPDC